MSRQSLIDKVGEACAELFPRGSRVLVAVSGGADSVACFLALHHLREKLGIQDLDVAHVNHGLRRNESDGDEKFVRSLAKKHGAAFHGTRLDGKGHDSSGIEQWARTQRYEFFGRMRREHGYDCVATGHTANDQAETLLLRLMRGTGLRGMVGIRARRDDCVVRPLLGIERTRIEEWLAKQGIGFRTDASNLDMRFKRNWVRHRVLPAILKQEPNVVELICACAHNFCRIRSGVEPFVNKWVIENVINQAETRFAIRTKGLDDRFLASHALVEELEKRGVSCSRKQVVGLLDVKRGSGKRYLLPGGWSYRVAGDRVALSRGEIERCPTKFAHELRIPGTTYIEPLGVEFRSSIVEKVPGMDELQGDNTTVFLDAMAVGQKLEYRSINREDRFRPLGSTRERAALEFLKNQGVHREERNSMGVVCTVEGEIVWIPRAQIGHRFRVESHTPEIVRISYKKA